MDSNQLRCSSPIDDYGKPWEVACNDAWYSNYHPNKLIERIWTITMVILLNIGIVVCAAQCFKKWVKRRKEAEREEERLQNLETTREV